MAPTVTDSNGRVTKKLRVSFDASARYASKPLTVIVGSEGTSEAQTFCAPEDILTSHSDFFAAAVRKGWREAEERVVRLPEQDPEHFQVFLGFLYSGKICSFKDGDRDQEKETDREWRRLALCWLLGEALMSTVFQDTVTDALVRKAKDQHRVPIGLQYLLYGRSATPNSLSRLVVEIAIWCWEPASWDMMHNDSNTPKAFLHDLVRRLTELAKLGPQGKGDKPWLKEDCTYHEHVKAGKPCYKTLFGHI